MSETAKLRRYIDALQALDAVAPNPEFPGHWETERRQKLLALITGQSVLALQEQLADYRRTVGGTDVVQCKVCRGTGHGSGLERVCPGCKGSGLVRV